ncbi:MAG: TonB-dependent receptor [Acidobacteriaceae bacterium]|nr:TonB-dependent receptor [Acidobacteriaceae bacterium]
MQFRRLSCFLLAVFFWAAYLPAQTVTGSITGTILDPSGAAVGGVQVEAVNTGTGLRRTAESSESGTYTIAQLPPGVYDLSVQKPGFAKETHRGLQLLVNQNITFDFNLSLSTVSQDIEVTAAPPALEAQSATLGQVVQHDQIVDLPLNGRSFTQLVLLTPGAAPVQSGQQGAFTIRQGAGGISPSVNGQRGQQNNFTMDGVLNNAVYTDTWAVSPPPDALQEFNVQSHITDAQFAISSGANINIATRPGTNQFHGSLWEFFRNDKLDARNFFDQRKPPYRQNQYGVYFGGPVRLPYYNGRDKTWFSVYWEGFRSRQSGSYFASVPTAAMRQGDFSAVLGPQAGVDSIGRPYLTNQIFDPATSRPDPTNPGNVLRDPFPGNIIPSNRLSPGVQLVLQKYYPLPNLAVGPNVLPNYQFAQSTATDNDQTGIRIDHRFGDNDSIYGRYNRSHPTLTRPESLPTYTQSLDNYAQTVAVGFTHLFGPTTILNLRYGYTETNFGQFDQPSGLQFLQATNYVRINPERNGIPLGPQIGLSEGYTGVSQFAIPLGPQQNHDGHVDLSMVRGNHTIGVGAMVYHIHSFDDGWGLSTSFTRNATSQGGVFNNTGLGAASFMLGLPDSLFGFLGDTSADASTFWYAGYVQDKWQVSSKLTITAGLRYDFVHPPNYKNNKVSGLDPDTGAFLIPTAFPPLFQAPNVRKTFFDPKYNGWQPRFGLAYRASEKTVIRSAFAIFDDHNNVLVQESQDPRISWPQGYGVSVSTLNRGLPDTSFDNLPLASSFLDPLQPKVAFTANPRNKIPYAMEYNAGIEQQLANSLVLSLDYVGSGGRHLFIQPQINTARIPGPGSLVSRGQRFSQYAGGSISNSTNIGTSSYNSLQAKLQKSLSFGLTFLASYTWSKSLDIQSEGQSGSIETEYDLRRDWGPSDFDRRHLLTISGTYALPFGKGKTHLANANGFTQALLGGWNLGGIYSYVSGAPFSIVAGGDIANVGGGNQRAQVVGDPLSGFTQSRLEWFNTAAFTLPANYTFGNEGRNNMFGPGQTNIDFITFKDFALTESMKIQFRGEFFNVMNHPRFGLPDNNVQDTSFGVITTAGAPRDIQFALKFLF